VNLNSFRYFDGDSPAMNKKNRQQHLPFPDYTISQPKKLSGGKANTPEMVKLDPAVDRRPQD
jgi:hypothetical protein